ncbi:UNVERIFIED_CONTAM: hypothetical protein GTU68_005722 [Idotea baltica]|nr:hypothetical protein [Idotea baltica]
MDQFKTV